MGIYQNQVSVQQQMIPDIGGVSVLGIYYRTENDCESDDEYTIMNQKIPVSIHGNQTLRG